MKTNWQNAVITLSMLTMPISAAINFGAAAYNMLQPRVGFPIAIVGGVATGIGFETLGIMAGHYAIAYYGKGDKRWIISAAVMVAYVGVGSFEMRDIELARFVPFLGAMVYILAGLGIELTAVNRDAQSRQMFDLKQEAADRELERQLKRQALTDKTAVKLAQVQVRASTEPAQSKIEPALASYECEDCNRQFATVQALNAHGRFCVAKVHMNGAAK
jgi:hypothetical protein